MVSYTTIRLFLGFAAIFVFVFMLNGLPCLGDAEEIIRTNNIRMFQNNPDLSGYPQEISIEKNHAVPKQIGSGVDKIKIWGIFPNLMFELVESVGRKHSPTDNNKAKQASQYIVRPGDTLWNIAAEQLGDASRYNEISKLNSDILQNENDLTIGMRLSLPDQ